jgi:preprotein translocase subunit SecG
MQYLIMLLLLLVSVFLILLILIQRGKGGGLAGAFGGMGGQSAFGAKAGDTFMRITVVVSLIWILLCVAALLYFNTMGAGGSRLEGLGGPPGATEQVEGENALGDEGGAAEDNADDVESPPADEPPADTEETSSTENNQ